MHKNQLGNWEAPLPFKTDEVNLPDNKEQCLRRLLSLKRKLCKDERARENYIAFMQMILERQHASRVPGKVWYLPHFDVYHPKKPDQVRVVFDRSALHNSQSLNKNLLQGPYQLNSLIGVLTRFRKEGVALTCAVANYSLHKTAETGRAEFGDKAADFLCRNFYVEDGLTSVLAISEAIELIEDSQALCASAKLRLHKFASNRKDVLEALPKDDRAKDLKDLDLRHDALPVQRSLGTYWCIESDTLGFRIELKDKPLSRRGILSTISSVYDPLGIVSPVILTGKKILQDLCRQKDELGRPAS